MVERVLDRVLRPLYIFPVLALLVVVAVLFSPADQPAAAVRTLTTYGTGPFAARGIYEVLGRLGWTVQRRRAPFDTTVRTEAVYALLDPPQSLSATEVGALLDAVRGGARVVLVGDAGAPLADSIGLAPSAPTYGNGFRVARPQGGDPVDSATRRVFDATRRMRDLDRYLRPTPRFREDTNPPLPADLTTLVRMQVRDTAEPLIAARRFGRGTIVTMADPSFLQNRLVRQEDAAVLAERLFEWVDPARRAPLVFDEFHHGYGERGDMMGTVADALAHTAPGRGLLQLLVAAVVLLVAYAIRPIAPLARHVLERRSPLEHVGALSRAYEQIDATRLATRRLVRGLRRRHPLGTPGTLGDDQYLTILAARTPALGPEVEQVRAALRHQLPATEWVAVGGAIDHIERMIAQ